MSTSPSEDSENGIDDGEKARKRREKNREAKSARDGKLETRVALSGAAVFRNNTS